MKKIFFSMLILTVIFTPISAYAQTVTLPMPTGATPSPGPTAVAYELPYPGVLPGSPLYLLKSCRDKISEILTTDPLKKSNFYLLQADKKLSSSLMLYKNKNTKEAEKSLLKSQIYLEKSVNKMIEAKKSQKNVDDLYGKIKNSSVKQEEEIITLLKTANGDDAQVLEQSMEKIKQTENRVDAFSH